MKRRICYETTIIGDKFCLCAAGNYVEFRLKIFGECLVKYIGREQAVMSNFIMCNQENSESGMLQF